jgi:PAS domain S-box-containing protein
MRTMLAFGSFVILLVGVFFVFQYYDSQSVLIAADPSYAARAMDPLLKTLLGFGVGAALLFALLVYTALSIRTMARRMAYQLSKDISLTKEQFRRFYELSPVPYLLMNKHGAIQRPNKAFLRFIGSNEEEIDGKDIFSYLSQPDHPDKLSIYKEQAARSIPIEQKEVQVLRASGEQRWALLSVEDLTTPGASERVSLVTLVDIHEQKELERIKTEFLSLASHQLRAPLANLKWYIDFLLTRRLDDLNEEVKGYLHKMYDRNEDMIDLVNTLLNLSRVEMGRIQIQKEKTDITKVAQGVIEELTNAAAEKEIAIQAALEPSLSFDTDPKLLRIVLQNLLSNAIRYTPQGGTVTVSTHHLGTALHMEVRDTGVGIPPDEQGKIFAKLYRASNAQAMEVNGNGIGLYMCKALVESMLGSITFQSVLGHGTTFTVELPA